MINTIFYFAESLSLEDYISQVQSGEISPKTIVLASELKSVYKGGRMFGRMLYEDLKSEIEKMFRDDDSPSVKRYIQDLIDSRAYDDTLLRNALSEVNNAITRLNNTADSEQNRLDLLLNTLNSRVQSAFEGLLTDANWVLQNMPKQEVTWKSGWDDEVKAVLSTVGYWDGDGENWTTKYSRIVQSVNSISSTVADIQSNQYDGSTVTEAISSAIDLAITDGIASLDLSTSFTQVTEDANKIKEVVQWLYSGLKSLTSPNYGTFASLYAAGSNNINNAISEIRAEVTKLKNGEYLATSSVESAVDGAIAGLYNKVTNTHASAEVFSKIKSNSTAIAGLETSVGEVLTDVDGLKTTLSSTANLIAALGDASSGLVLKTTYDGDLADLNAGISENATAIANLSTQVGGLSAGVLNEVDTRIRTATSTLVARSEVENGTIAASVVAKVNEEGSLLKLNADRIDLTADFISAVALDIQIDASKITLNADFINAIGADVTVKKLSVKRNDADIDPTINIGVSGNIGNITLRDPSVTVDGHYAKVSEIKSDGSINFANGTFIIPKNFKLYGGVTNKGTLSSDYAGGIIIKTGSSRNDFDKLSNLLIESPFSFRTIGSGLTALVNGNNGIGLYSGLLNIFGDLSATFTYREEDYHAEILSLGPYFYKDVTDDRILCGSKLQINATSLGYILNQNDEHNYISNGSENSLSLFIYPGYRDSLFKDTNGLILFENKWADSDAGHCAVFRVGGEVRINSQGSYSIPGGSCGIKAELLNGVKIGVCVKEFGPGTDNANNPQIQILNLKGKFKDTLNKVIPYKDDSGNTKYLGIVGGLIVYDGDGGTNLNDVYTAVGITNPNS